MIQYAGYVIDIENEPFLVRDFTNDALEEAYKDYLELKKEDNKTPMSLAEFMELARKDYV